MYQVLYRKWRPKVFADVVGQPQVTETLKNELRSGHIAHAYLFTGSRGTGKTTCAKILSKAVNCLDLHDGDPCGACEICRGLEEGSILDVVEIDAASNNGVDNIRSLREEANFTPAQARYRVYIIDEVHMLSPGAFNALLKTLEEPPAHVIFILATTEVHKLPATILSRCQRFDFHRIAVEDIAARLQYVAEQEGAQLEEEAALLIARLADGGMRDALSLLDQCFGRSRQVDRELVEQTAGIAGRDHLFAIAEHIFSGEVPPVLEQVDILYRGSKDMVRLCEELIEYFRGLMLLKTMKKAGSLLTYTQNEIDRMEQQALRLPITVILHGIDALQAALERMNRVSNRRVELEMTLIRLCSPELDYSQATILRRLDALERKVSQGVPMKAEVAPVPAALKPEKTEPLWPEEIPVRPEEPALKKEPPRQAEVATPPAEKKQPEKRPLEKPVRFAEWPEVLQLISRESRTVAAAFHGSGAYVSGDFMLIAAKNDLAFELLRRPDYRNKMRDAIRQVTGRVYKLGPYKDEQQASALDPLKALEQKAQQAGIEVVHKTSETGKDEEI